MVSFKDRLFVARYDNIIAIHPDGTSRSIIFNADANTQVVSLFVADGYLYLVTSGPVCYYAIWRRPLSDFGISSVSPQPQPLSQNIYSYPNPFTESAEIVVNSQTAGYADVSIVNILGAPVAHLFSGELGAGNHSFAWGAHGVAPGSYWCIVRMGGRVEKVAVLRE